MHMDFSTLWVEKKQYILFENKKSRFIG